MATYELPPILKGTEQQQLVSMRDYLVRLAQSLDRVSDTSTQITVQAKTLKKDSGNAAAATLDNLIAQATTLKSLIIKTADTVLQEVGDNYVKTSYLSPEGEYHRDLMSNVSETAEAIVRDYNYTDIVTGIVGADIAQLQSYVTILNGEIRLGLIYDPGLQMDVLGIAISQKLEFLSGSGNTYADPTTNLVYTRIAENQTFGFYTSRGWQFWVNGQKVGWFDSMDSSGALHISSAVVEQHIQMGDKWLLDITGSGDGIGFRYIGE